MIVACTPVYLLWSSLVRLPFGWRDRSRTSCASRARTRSKICLSGCSLQRTNVICPPPLPASRIDCFKSHDAPHTSKYIHTITVLYYMMAFSRSTRTNGMPPPPALTFDCLNNHDERIYVYILSLRCCNICIIVFVFSRSSTWTAQADPLRREAKIAIAKKVRQLRHAHQLAAAAASADGDGAPGEDDRVGGAAAALEASMPEYVLPYAIHLLAHHPDFPVDKASDYVLFQQIVKCVSVGSLISFTWYFLMHPSEVKKRKNYTYR